MTQPEDSTGLRVLSPFPFLVQSSPDLVEHTRLLAERFECARGFLHQTLDVTPQVGLRVLSAADWPTHAHTAFMHYGTTHLDTVQAMVITGGPDSTFWHAFVDSIAAAGPDLLGELRETYGQADGTIDLTRHIEWWIVHDLGHACHAHLGYWFPRVWLMEFFADLCLYTYLASNEPAYLPALETLPRVLSLLPFGSLYQLVMAFLFAITFISFLFPLYSYVMFSQNVGRIQDRVYNLIIQHLGSPIAGRILDIGSGNGVLAVNQPAISVLS
jgi:hypothetical protein